MYINLRKLIPELSGNHLFTVQVSTKSLERMLTQHGFKIYSIDGSITVDQVTFFQEITRVLNIPSEFGNSWTALENGLKKFVDDLKTTGVFEKVTVLWEDADKSFAADANTFLEAVFTMERYAYYAIFNHDSQGRVTGPSIQFEIFLLGNSAGFTRITV
jgi:RNAse (barnase) inhibitor barstar